MIPVLEIVKLKPVKLKKRDHGKRRLTLKSLEWVSLMPMLVRVSPHNKPRGRTATATTAYRVQCKEINSGHHDIAQID